MESKWIEFIGKNVPSSKNSKTWTGKILIKSKLCQQYIKWAEPLFKAQKDEWEKMKQEHTERPLMVGIYFYRDSKRKFDFNNVSQILCDMMTANDYIEDDNINEMVPVYLGHEVVKKEQSGVKLSIVNMEIWKDIPDYPKYQVSNMGNVRSLDYMHTGEIKNLCFDIVNGYSIVLLYNDEGRKSKKVHRLVAEAFIPNPDNLPMINHKDENPGNNVVSNLEWCDAKYNNNYGTSRERMSEKLRGKKRPDVAERFSQKVLQFTLDGKLVKEWPSAMECSRNGFNQGHITECCGGKRKKHKGFIWKYKYI